MNIKTVVIPAAGYGTRFLPYTKSIPKEMVPLVDVPALHVIFQEAIAAGISSLCCIVSKEKECIEDYFSHSPALTAHLASKQKLSLLDPLEQLLGATHRSYVIQHEAHGLGHAVLMARHAVAEPFFAVMLPDDIIVNQQGALDQLISCARIHKATVLAVCEVPPHAVSSYGVIRPGEQLNQNLFIVEDIVEKPHPSHAPSNLAVIGRYVLSSTIFDALESLETSPGKELQLTDGIASLIHTHRQPVLALKIEGARFDIGNPLGWMKAVVSMGLNHPEYGPQLRTFISTQLTQTLSMTDHSHHFPDTL